MKIHIIGCSGSGKTYLANALSKKYNNDEWIIEGVYYAWVQQFFDEADKIDVLDMPSYLYKSRIIMRSIKRKLGIRKGKKDIHNTDSCKWHRNRLS